MEKSSTKGKLILACAALLALTAGGGIYSALHNGYQSAYATEASNSANVTFVPGASVRADEQEDGVTGIRFRATVGKELYESMLNAEKTAYKDGYEVGMIIVPAEVFNRYESQSEYTDVLTYIKEGLGATGDVSVNITPEKVVLNSEGTGYVLTGVVDMLENNYIYEYQATVYYKTAEVYSYEAYSDARSLAYVANAALNDTTETAPSDAQKNVYAEKVAKTVDKRFQKAGCSLSGTHEVTLVTSKPDEIDLNTYFAEVTAADKSFTVTSGSDVATLSAGVLTPQKNGTVTVAVSAYGGKLNYKVNLRISNPFYDGYEEVKAIAMAQWPDENSLDVTESTDVPEGYTKAYAFTMGWQWGYRKNLANVDISKYSTVKFKIKATDLKNPSFFHLYQGDTYLKNFYYADTSWHEIVLTKNADGVWSMTAGGDAVAAFSSTATNLKDMFNLSLGNTNEADGQSHFVVSNIIGLPLPAAIKDGYEEVKAIAMAQWPDDNSVGVTEETDMAIPDGYTKVYGFTEGWQWGYRRNLANVDISGYSTVSFMIKTTDLKNPGNFHLYQGDTYLKNFYYADTSWHEIVLTQDSNGVWSMTADGTAVGDFSSTETNLKDMFNLSLGNTTEGCPDSHFYVTNIIGVKLP